MKQTLPYWHDLPTLDLYLDQVLEFTNSHLEHYFSDPQTTLLTASMVNNYVKHQHIPKPIKKKYTRQHVATLLIISLMKNVFTIQDLSQLLHTLLKHDSPEKVYNMFIASLHEEDLPNILPVIHAACRTLSWYTHTKKLAQQGALHVTQS